MTPLREIQNVAASVHQRLLNLARDQRVEFNLILQRYAVERFLYRLALSSEVDRFTLKGAVLLYVWTGQMLRPTRDVDLGGADVMDDAMIRLAMERICAVPYPDDGVMFDPASMQIEDIRDEQGYGGVRVRLHGNLGRARLALQVDIAFGDPITPQREAHDYPTLLDHAAPHLWTCPRDTVIAEKFEAMVRRGGGNSRVKDLWDVAFLSRRFAFDGSILREAIVETFRRCRTVLAGERPEALRPTYYDDSTRAKRWEDFHRQLDPGLEGPGRLVDVGTNVRDFLGPVCDSILHTEPFTSWWPAGGPWQSVRFRSEGNLDV